MIINIIPAPTPKKAVVYDPIKDEVVFETADVIGLVEVINPDNEQEGVIIPMYMCSNSMGTFYPPQMDINFLELIPMNKDLDLSKYVDTINELKKYYQEIEEGIIEVETKGNVSSIKRFIKPSKKDKPKND